uniref:Uncharacterized protein n=3 Tax=Canis lupus TaxID=9612 RepID=A0A8C0M2F0_CANLF
MSRKGEGGQRWGMTVPAWLETRGIWARPCVGIVGTLSLRSTHAVPVSGAPSAPRTAPGPRVGRSPAAVLKGSGPELSHLPPSPASLTCLGRSKGSRYSGVPLPSTLES